VIRQLRSTALSVFIAAQVVGVFVGTPAGR
jgi:hypothetical protein